MVEQIVGVIDNAITHKVIGGRYNIVFTSQRIIVAQAESFKKMLGVGIIGGVAGEAVGGVMGARIAGDRIRQIAEEAAEKMRSSSPEMILASDKSNLSIPYDNVVKIEIIRGSFWKSTMMRVFVDEKKYYEYLLVNRGLSMGVSQELFDKYVNIIKQAISSKLVIS